MQQEKQVQETMTVTVMYRNNWFGGDGWTYYPKTITISAFCPKCGQRRGKPYQINQHEDGEWFSLDRWDNPCGHLDTYREALLEARQRNEGDADGRE